MVLGDGMSWRRAVEPGFDAEKVLPLILTMVRCLLANPGAMPGDSAAAAGDKR
jgi:hypothetical protein